MTKETSICDICKMEIFDSEIGVFQHAAPPLHARCEDGLNETEAEYVERACITFKNNTDYKEPLVFATEEKFLEFANGYIENPATWGNRYSQEITNIEIEWSEGETTCSTCEGAGKVLDETPYRAARTAGMDFKFASWIKIEDAKDECANAAWLSDADRLEVEEGEECYIVTTYDECEICGGRGTANGAGEWVVA